MVNYIINSDAMFSPCTGRYQNKPESDKILTITDSKNSHNMYLKKIFKYDIAV